jgi:hypothetical protein
MKSSGSVAALPPWISPAELDQPIEHTCAEFVRIQGHRHEVVEGRLEVQLLLDPDDVADRLHRRELVADPSSVGQYRRLRSAHSGDFRYRLYSALCQAIG